MEIPFTKNIVIKYLLNFKFSSMKNNYKIGINS